MPVHFAVNAAEAPTTASIQNSLDKIAERKLPEADQKALQQVLEQTLNLLNSKEDSEKKLAALKQQLASAPRKPAKARKNWPSSRKASPSRSPSAMPA